MPTILLQHTYSLTEIHEMAALFWPAVRNYNILAFSGEMGAGKTTFIHSLCECLEVEDSVSSPTFALINEYHFEENNEDRTIFHMDWYRLKNAAEAINAGMEECMLQAIKNKEYCFIEWPEKAQELLQQPYLWIHIETINETERKITISQGA